MPVTKLLFMLPHQNCFIFIGFYKSYHKMERNKKDKFFEDHHKGGDYKKYGQGREKHYSKSSVKKAKKDGKTSSSSTFTDSKKKSKIK